MKNAQTLLKSYLTNKWTIISALSIITLFIVVSNLFINRSFVNKIRQISDEELGKRLCLVGSKIAESIEYDIILENIPSSFEFYLPSDLTFLNSHLETEQKEANLQALFIVDRQFHTVVAFPAVYQHGERVTHLTGDSLYFRKALQDSILSSKLYEVSGNYFKTAYAPLKNDIGTVIGVVIVEASAKHFNTIRGFQNYMNWGLTITFSLFFLAIVFIYWIVTQFTQLQISAQRNQRLASMGQMAATVAHEIRNPLGIIKSTAEVIKARHKKNNIADDLIDFIPAEVDRLNRLITDFLTFARDRELKLVKADFIATVYSVVKELQHDFTSAAIQIEINSEFNELIVTHDSDGIKQILINLAQNAAQAMENTGIITVSINVISSWSKRFVQVEISDTGPGIIEPEKIFEPFFTTKTNGSGLGLAVTQQIIVKHGGKISASNKPGGGAVFQILIPV
ncbi:MAG: hypothetical protein H6696_04970 [Deferribacteres bacterium]|nr:hypothetical protein [candidate division KSB1 bacterium]MCB9501268.1 hypothetical protein [Deferribacteres bacterium]